MAGEMGSAHPRQITLSSGNMKDYPRATARTRGQKEMADLPYRRAPSGAIDRRYRTARLCRRYRIDRPGRRYQITRRCRRYRTGQRVLSDRPLLRGQTCAAGRSRRGCSASSAAIDDHHVYASCRPVPASGLPLARPAEA